MVAIALFNVTGAPSGVIPSLNWIVPVALLGLTVAVNVTLWPKATGFCEEVNPTLVKST